MIKRLIKITFIPLIVLGTILTAVIFFTEGNDLTVIQKTYTQIGTYRWEYYNFNIQLYLINLENSLKASFFTNLGNNIMPSSPALPDWTDITSILKWIGNNLIFTPNMFIFLVNTTIILPTKLLIYPINIIITILGINTTNLDYVKIINTISSTYIKYISYLS
jgi:hypothetical protein